TEPISPECRSMSNRATCPQGHQWEMTPDGQEARCPVCGAVGLGATESGVQTSQPAQTEALDQTLQRPSPAPSTLLPEFTPGNTPGALDVTLVHPRARASADRQVPPQLDQTMDPQTLPRQPQLVTAGVGSGTRAPKPEPAVGGYEVIATLGRGGMG